MFFDEAGVTATHVPYKGVGPMLTDLIGGQVEIGALSLPSVQQHLKSGALRAIGVGTAQALGRCTGNPDDGRAGVAELPRRGLVRGHRSREDEPGRRQADHAMRSSAAFATPEVQEAMAKQGNTINVSTTEYANQFFRSELAKYAKLVKKTGIELQ